MGEAVLSAGGTNLELQPRRDSRGYSFNHADDRPRNLAEPPVKQSIGLVCLVVRDYDEALAFYVGTLGFEKVAHFKQVGRKFDRWLDLVFVQKFL